MAKKRLLTIEEEADARRLRDLWEVKKKQLGLTQEIVANECGWETQGAFEQYVNGRIPLNLEAAIKIAQALKCSIREISPRFAELLIAATTNLDPEVIHLSEAIQTLPPDSRATLQKVADAFAKSQPWDGKVNRRTGK